MKSDKNYEFSRNQEIVKLNPNFIRCINNENHV